MNLENQLPPLSEWFGVAAILWVATLAAVGLGGLLFSFLFSAARYGPNRAGDTIYQTVGSALGDLFFMSPRRVGAIAWVTIQESRRRKVVVGFIIFVILLLFAAWYLPVTVVDPARLYLSFVLSGTTFLCLLVAVMLSAFSLPQDIQNRTIYTVVTKPVRPSEIVLGRTLGFVAIGTAMLGALGLLSYFFVTGSLRHTHSLPAENLTEIRGGDVSVSQLEGYTTEDRGHRHLVTLGPDGTGLTEVEAGHSHKVTVTERDGRRIYSVGPALDQFKAKVPIYGKLSFKDRAGKDVTRGISVGYEWAYRSYIEGGTQAAAIWRFSGLTADRFPEGLSIEATIRVFRTTKGEIERGILGSLVLRNPRTGRTSKEISFYPREFNVNSFELGVELPDPKTVNGTLGLFTDLVDNGELEVILKCLDRTQFFGLAQADLYILPREANFELNLFKSYASIWLQMVMVIAFGVMFSTFLNGPVAMLATLFTLVFGFYSPFVRDLSFGRLMGGGPLESWVRMVGGLSQVGELDPTVTNTVVQGLDKVSQIPLFIAARIIPDFGSLSSIEYVASGFDIPWNVMAIHTLIVLGYVIPVLLAGFLFFKIREVAK